MRLLILLLISLFFVETSAQFHVSGTLVDQQTGAALPFAHVVKKETKRGVVTNEDGFFRLTCVSTDTLIFSFIGYKKSEVPCSYFKDHEKLALIRSNNELNGTTVFSDYSFLYDLFKTARKKLLRSGIHNSKAYFSLETSSNNIPVELLECYYNAELYPSGIRELKLKNGRIGMSNSADYFTSLNTTQVISDYSLTDWNDVKFPTNPLHFSKGKLKKYFDLKLIGLRNGVYQIQFFPRKNPTRFYQGTMWIDKKSQQLVKLKCFQKNLTLHPFITTDPNHSFDSLNFEVVYTFSNAANQYVRKIEFHYDLKYRSTARTNKIRSNGIFLFYDRANTFHLPYYMGKGIYESDYEKIIAQPYNEQFWKYNEVISPSKKVVAYKDFFRENGVLLNFDKLSQQSNLFRNKTIPWSTKRILLHDINGFIPDSMDTGEGEKKLVPANLYRANVVSELTREELEPLLNKVNEVSDVQYNYTEGGELMLKWPTNLYRLQADIYLDRNVFNDSTFYFAQTLIDMDRSFYDFQPHARTNCFLNLYFDIIEVERRKMLQTLQQKEWSITEVDSIYHQTRMKIRNLLTRYLEQVEHGENEEELQSYIEWVIKELGINNTVLIPQE